jgi:hypothetical protein
VLCGADHGVSVVDFDRLKTFLRGVRVMKTNWILRSVAWLVSLGLLPVVSSAADVREELGIVPVSFSIPQPSGPLCLESHDIASVEVLGLTVDEVQDINVSGRLIGVSSFVMPSALGDIFDDAAGNGGSGAIAPGWTRIRAEIAANRSSSRFATVGVGE